MPIHLHLDLPTSSNPVLPIPPHTSPTRTLYHSKRLEDPQTKDAFTSALAKKVAKISHTFTRLTTQLHSSKITPQSFADTANAALSEILQHAAHVVLGKVDPHTPKNVPDKSTAQHTVNHHSPKTPRKLIPKVQSNITGTQSTPSKKTCLSMMPTHLPSTVTNSKRRKMPSTRYEKLKNKTNHFPPSNRM